MGWSGAHLHGFRIGRTEYGPHLGDGLDDVFYKIHDDSKVKLAKVLPRKGTGLTIRVVSPEPVPVRRKTAAAPAATRISWLPSGIRAIGATRSSWTGSRDAATELSTPRHSTFRASTPA